MTRLDSEEIEKLRCVELLSQKRCVTHRPALIVVLTLLVVAFLFCAYMGRCVGLVAKSIKPVVVPMPASCRQTSTVENNDVTTALEQQRIERGLNFQGWVECDPPTDGKLFVEGLERDSHWLETYIAVGYGYRRTVVVLRPGGLISKSKTHVVAAIFVKPWVAYLSMIRGQCDGKLRVWK